MASPNGIDTGANQEYASLMPPLTEDGDIHQALQYYHYGNPDNKDFSPDSFPAGKLGGIARRLKDINDSLTSLTSDKTNKSTLTTKGDIYVATANSTITRLGVGTDGAILKANSLTASGLEWSTLETSYLNLTGGTLVGDLTISKTSPILRINATSGASSLFLDSIAGAEGLIRFRTGTSARWAVSKNNVAEGGSNAGSNFIINSYTDAGVLLATPLQITRSTGLTTLTSLTVTGDTTLSGTFNVGAVSATSLSSSTSTTTSTLIVNTTSTLTGAVTASSTISASTAPSAGAHLTNKTYVDAQTALRLSLTGGTLSGALNGTTASFSGTVSVAEPTVAGHAATRNYVDNTLGTKAPLDSPTFTGSVTAAFAPTLGGHLVNKTYTDATYMPLAGGAFSGDIVGKAADFQNGLISGTTLTVGTVLTVLGTSNFNDQILLSASTTTRSGFRLTPGDVPTNPSNGDMWINSGRLYTRLSGVTLGQATLSDKISDFAAVTSAQLAAKITDSTGSGSAVFATNPALAGNPTAPTQPTGNDSTRIATTAYVNNEIVNDAVRLAGSYDNPSWLTGLAKSKVGLSNVENTALSTWAGSNNITNVGTINTLVTTGNVNHNNGNTYVNGYLYNRQPVIYKSANFQLGANDDSNTLFRCGAAMNITVPKDGTYDYPIGTQFHLVRMVAGAAQFVAEDGNVHFRGDPIIVYLGVDVAKARAQYSVISIVKTGSNEWVVFGDLAG